MTKPLPSSNPTHFLDLKDFDRATLEGILEQAAKFKAGEVSTAHTVKTLATIFEKPSTRTRVSFDQAMHRLGGHTQCLSSGDLQLGRGETIADTARVLSRYVDVIMLRTKEHHKLLELAEYATVPVINGLTDRSHPCQIMADLLTVQEWRGRTRLDDFTAVWVGDPNNVYVSWQEAAKIFGFTLKLSCPSELGDGIADPYEAVGGADCIITDTWVSMGVDNPERQIELLKPYQVTQDLVNAAGPKTFFLHCLPATRGQEVTAAVIDGERSAVWDEAENRMHAQQAILDYVLSTS